MFRQMKWLIGLCAIGATVLITAVKQDDCDPGDQPPAPNSRTESGAVPRAFMNRPALAEMLRSVPANLRTRGEIFGNLYHEQYSGSLGYDRRTKVNVDCCAVHNGDINRITCLEGVAQALEEFRAAARVNTAPIAVDPNELHAMLLASDDDNILVSALSLRYYDAAREIAQFGDSDAAVRYLKDALDLAGLSTIVTYHRACGIVPASTMIGDATMRCLRATAERMRSTQGCPGLTGPVACDPPGGGIPGEISWDGAAATPRSDPPQPGIVRDGD